MGDVRAMPTPVLVAWILAAPFAVMGSVAASPVLRRGVARFYWLALALGWAGFALVAFGAIATDRGARSVALLAGAPLLGLCVWVRQRRHDGGERPAPRPDPGDPPDAIDWDRFMRDLEQWSAARDARAADIPRQESLSRREAWPSPGRTPRR
jgi:hypothetical protein